MCFGLTSPTTLTFLSSTCRISRGGLEAGHEAQWKGRILLLEAKRPNDELAEFERLQDELLAVRRKNVDVVVCGRVVFAKPRQRHADVGVALHALGAVNRNGDARQAGACLSLDRA